MTTRAQAVLAYLDANSDKVNEYGAAFAETEILRALINGESDNLFRNAHYKKMLRGVPSPQNRSEVLGLTHDIFFASDFGKRELPGVDLDGYANLGKSHFAEYEDDLNVFGELLMCCHILDRWDAVCDTAFTAFTVAVDAISGDNFNEDYHKILVGGLLFQMRE